MAKDMTAGSKSVKITGQEVMLKNKSYFKKSYGDEAGCATKKGIVSSVNRGKVYFISWSMDVKFEGENVVRHLDMTTHNHASPTTNTAPWTYADRMAMAKVKGCKEQRDKIESACDPWEEKSQCLDSSSLDNAKAAVDEELTRLWNKPENLAIPTGSPKWKLAKKRGKRYQAALKKLRQAYKDYARKVNENDCHRALKCALSPKEPSKCCEPQTPHHLIDGNAFRDPDVDVYDYNAAPCICAVGHDNSTGTHGLLHLRQREELEKLSPPIKLKNGIDVANKAIEKVFPNSGCDPECIAAQLKNEHRKMGIGVNQEITPKPSGEKIQSFDKPWAKFNKKLGGR
jgi:hypothetical protein